MFKVSFTTSAARLEKLLSATASAGISGPAIEYFEPAVTEAPSKIRKKKRGKAGSRRAHDGQILSLTSKKTAPGTKREEVTTTLEKLEGKHGVGKVTRKMLRDSCTELGVDHQIIYQLLQEGFLKTG